MDIFESLENLNVSEECFEDIVGLVEEIMDKLATFKDGKLYDKMRKIQRDEFKQAAKREGKTEDEIFNKRFRDKNKLGAEKQFDRYPEEPITGDGDYGMQFVPVQKQHSKNDYEAHVAKHGAH